MYYCGRLFSKLTCTISQSFLSEVTRSLPVPRVQARRADCWSCSLLNPELSCWRDRQATLSSLDTHMLLGPQGIYSPYSQYSSSNKWARIMWRTVQPSHRVLRKNKPVLQSKTGTPMSVCRISAATATHFRDMFPTDYLMLYNCAQKPEHYHGVVPLLQQCGMSTEKDNQR